MLKNVEEAHISCTSTICQYMSKYVKEMNANPLTVLAWSIRKDGLREDGLSLEGHDAFYHCSLHCVLIVC